jgi:hypothetical protein
MGWLSRFLGLGARPHPPARPLIVWREGSYPTCAVGESYYQGALSRICGGHNRDGHRFECEAHLIPEPDNPYDINAVKVVVQGLHVGHLSREDAVRFHEEMALAGQPGGARCAARLDGGWRTNQHDEGSFGIRLGIPGRGRFTLTAEASE